MQVASILSDLTSLRACGHDEALALVRADRNLTSTSSSPSKTQKASIPTISTPEQEETDPDLQRALDLVDLHSSVKVKHLQGPDVGLQRACADVEAVRRKFQGKKG